MSFKNADEEKYYDDAFVAHRGDLCKALETSALRVTMKFAYPWRENSLCRLEIARVDDTELQKQMNLNYEFKLSSTDSLGKQIAEIPNVYAYFGRIQKSLLGES